MVQINWTVQAREDLQSIAKYIARDSLKYARLQIIRIRLRTKILTSHIYSGKIVEEINREDIRELIEGNYRIIYRIVDQEPVDILTVHHSARDLGKRKL
ncbi:type II toxin-antitoxin system RelE/ParE family toxin [Salinimicrobium sp. MT39]|uniref:Type II toxin-antitoxin system RelE/ParE family toxin n=1 Tax=Salinimicrobium profundisediminis TaxID=2994553 RepID=A0A9X3I2A3_9FLAO|nr:type II toxin-antitoxin system RelE/ParE family toxin [Salinimicrobium profundisediminis]MCX2838762.1 type II toxin-antitoxin system RelE/ParE family toxin [Salinimicrobium profundisediminis]